MLAGLALWSAMAIVIAPPAGPDDTCPSARQVADALQAHVPGQIVAADRGLGPARADLVRAQLDIPPDGTVIRFSLVDAQGGVQLRRVLPSPGRGRPVADCLALAETLAVIVERYLSSVPFEAEETPPPPAPVAVVVAPPTPAAPRPPRPKATSAFAGAAWRSSATTTPAFELRLGAGLDLTRGHVRLAGLLRIGLEQADQAPITRGSASLRRLAARAGLVLAFPAGPGVIEPAVEVGADIYLGSTTMGAGTAWSFRATPVIETRVGYRVALGRYLFVLPHAGGGFAAVTYDVTEGPARPPSPIFRTPTLFSTLGLDIGVLFR